MSYKCKKQGNQFLVINVKTNAIQSAYKGRLEAFLVIKDLNKAITASKTKEVRIK